MGGKNPLYNLINSQVLLNRGIRVLLYAKSYLGSHEKQCNTQIVNT